MTSNSQSYARDRYEMDYWACSIMEYSVRPEDVGGWESLPGGNDTLVDLYG